MCNSCRMVFHIKSSTRFPCTVQLIRSNFSLLLLGVLWKQRGVMKRDVCVRVCVLLDEAQSFHLFSLQSMSDCFLN